MVDSVCLSVCLSVCYSISMTMEETARNNLHFQNPEYIHSSKTCRAGAYRVGRITGYPACYYYAPAPIEWGHYGRRLCLYCAWLKTGRKPMTRVTRNRIYRSKVKVIRSQIQTASLSQRGPQLVAPPSDVKAYSCANFKLV